MDSPKKLSGTILYLISVLLISTNLFGQPPADNNIIIARGDWAHPPFEFINEQGEPDGFNVELFKAVMKELNLSYDLQMIHWPEAVDQLKKREIDVVLGMAFFQSRTNYYNFTIPHSYIYYNIISRKNSPVNSAAGLVNKEVIVQHEEITADILNELGISGKLINVDNMYDGLRLLSKGRHDVAMCGDMAAKYIINKRNIKNLNITYIPSIAPLKSCFATNKNNEELPKLLNKGLELVKAKGIYREIYNKWFQSYFQPEYKILKYTYYIIGVLVIILLGAFIIIHSIRRHIRSVTLKLNSLNSEMAENYLRTQLAIKTSNIIQWDYDCQTKELYIVQDPVCGGKDFITTSEYLNSIHPNDHSKLSPVLDRMNLREDFNFSIDVRMKYTGKDSWQFICIDGTPIKNNTGKVIKYTGFRKNNTRFIKLNEELKEKNTYLGMALRAGSVIPMIIDTETDIVSFAHKILDIKLFISKVHPDDKDIVTTAYNNLKKGVQRKISAEIRYFTNNDTEDDYEINYMGYEYNKQGKPGKIVGYFQNISKRKRAEVKLKRQQELLNNILDLISIPIHIKDVENGGVYVYRNKESLKIFGNELKMSTTDIFNVDDAKMISTTDMEVFETEIPTVTCEKIRTLDGREYETISHKNIIYDNGKKLLLVSRWDISEQNELNRKSKILSISMNALNSFSWFCDTRDGILRFGDGFEATGGSREQMNSMYNFAQKIHPLYRENFINFISKFCQQDSGEFSIEYEIDLAGNGKYEWWECRGTIAMETNNNVPYKYLYGMDINIDKRKKTNLELERVKNQVESANKFMLDIIDRLPCLLFIKDITDNYRYIIANDYFCKVLGKAKSEVIGKTDFDLFGKDEAQRYRRDDLFAVSENIQHVFEEETQWQGQHSFWQTTKAPMEAVNGHSLLIALSLDITEKISSYNELQHAKEKAEMSDKFKSTFLANMSHEIRTPLNAIVGFSNIIFDEDNLENRKEYRDIINANTDLLLRLIGDILDLSKIEAGMIDLKYQQFDLTELFTNLISTLAPRNTSADVEFICETPSEGHLVYLDKNRFTQVITNFATNAIKFTTKGSIKMGYELVDNGVRIYVTDTGVGISEDKIERVFERFEKLDDFAQGTGLGMAISKAIIDAFNGKIGVESKVGKGSTFWAWVPQD